METAMRQALATFTILVCASLLMACAHSAHAVGSLVDVAIVDRDTGQTLDVYHARGRHYVAGRPGARYAIRVTNRSGERVMAVMSRAGGEVRERARRAGRAPCRRGERAPGHRPRRTRVVLCSANELRAKFVEPGGDRQHPVRPVRESGGRGDCSACGNGDTEGVSGI